MSHIIVNPLNRKIARIALELSCSFPFDTRILHEKGHNIIKTKYIPRFNELERQNINNEIRTVANGL